MGDKMIKKLPKNFTGKEWLLLEIEHLENQLKIYKEWLKREEKVKFSDE